MCYTAFDGKVPRIAFTSISIEDFLSREWSKWTEPKIISPMETPDKDACLFPEKINGKFVFFHRIEPNITIDFFDDLEFKNATLKESEIIYPGSKFWDGVKIGVNTTPIKTAYGWLVFYHGISQIDHHYRVGAILIDLKDVTKVIARTMYPLIEPETVFERQGIVNDVVFPCGAIVKNGELFLYYGGADTVICGAKVGLTELLNYLLDTTQKKHVQLDE
jgi:predicted GH43/DUF377 family glycosyl hydrolase